MGLFGELVASVARFNYGWKPVGASGYDAFNIALDAFRMFGTDRQKAIKYLTDGETRHYDYLREKYPSGYDEYKKRWKRCVSEKGCLPRLGMKQIHLGHGLKI